MWCITGTLEISKIVKQFGATKLWKVILFWDTVMSLPIFILWSTLRWGITPIFSSPTPKLTKHQLPTTVFTQLMSTAAHRLPPATNFQSSPVCQILINCIHVCVPQKSVHFILYKCKKQTPNYSRNSHRNVCQSAVYHWQLSVKRSRQFVSEAVKN